MGIESDERRTEGKESSKFARPRWLKRVCSFIALGLLAGMGALGAPQGSESIRQLHVDFFSESLRIVNESGHVFESKELTHRAVRTTRYYDPILNSTYFALIPFSIYLHSDLTGNDFWPAWDSTGHGVKWQQISGDFCYTLGLGEDGELYEWGTIDGTRDSVFIYSQPTFHFRRIEKPAEVTRWISFSGTTHSRVAIGDNGESYTWSNEDERTIATEDITERVIQPNIEPRPVGVSKWKQVHISSWDPVFTCQHCIDWPVIYRAMLSENGVAYYTVQYGLPDLAGAPFRTVLGPKAVIVPPSLGRIERLVGHDIALGNDGALYKWNKPLTDPDAPMPNQISAKRLEFPPGVTSWKSVSGGMDGMIALGNDNRIYGLGLFFLPGSTDYTELEWPSEIPVPGSHEWTLVASGRNYQVAMDTNGNIVEWGRYVQEMAGGKLAWIFEVFPRNEEIFSLPDNYRPFARMRSPYGHYYFPGPTNITLKAEVADPEGKIASVRFLNNGHSLPPPIEYTNNIWHVESGVLEAAINEIQVEVTDDQGLVTVSEPSIVSIDQRVWFKKPLLPYRVSEPPNSSSEFPVLEVPLERDGHELPRISIPIRVKGNAVVDVDYMLEGDVTREAGDQSKFRIEFAEGKRSAKVLVRPVWDTELEQREYIDLQIPAAFIGAGEIVPDGASTFLTIELDNVVPQPSGAPIVRFFEDYFSTDNYVGEDIVFGFSARAQSANLSFCSVKLNDKELFLIHDPDNPKWPYTGEVISELEFSRTLTLDRENNLIAVQIKDSKQRTALHWISIRCVPLPTASVTLASGTNVLIEGESARLQVSLSNPVPNRTTLATFDIGGTATSGLDYVALPRTIHFPPGTTKKEIPFTAVGDAVVEPDETVTIALIPGPSTSALPENTLHSLVTASPGLSTKTFTIRDGAVSPAIPTANLNRPLLGLLIADGDTPNYLRILSHTNAVVQTDFSDDLKSWRPLLSVTNFHGRFDFLPPDTTNSIQFYRIREEGF